MSLKYLYKGEYFFSLSETYADYGAWSESCMGAGGLPSDESIELFLESLTLSGIQITDEKYRIPRIDLPDLPRLYKKCSPNQSNNQRLMQRNYDQYDGFIFTAFDDESEVEKTLALTEQGRKLIFIKFDARYAVSRFEDKSQLFLNALAINDDAFSGTISIRPHGFGKILLLKGSSVSDHQLDRRFEYKITEQILTELKQYDIPYFTADFLSLPPQAWLTNESLLLAVNLSNIGTEAKSVSINLEIDSNLEPLSSTEIYVNTVEHGETKTINFIVAATKSGHYKNYLSLKLAYANGQNTFIKHIPIVCETNFISTVNAIKSNEPSADKSELIKRYQNLHDQITDINGFDKVFELIEIDPSSTIVKCRSTLEKIINKLFAKYIGQPKGIDLDTKIRRLRDKGVLDNKLFGWLNTVRVLGNVMAHPEPDLYASKDDALVIVNILLNVIDELISKKLF